jgi:nucleotide-binding universal stress UspA family protein
LQVAIVAVMLLAFVWFLLGGTPAVETSRYDPLLTGGVTGLLSATGLVFVSYAGVLKIASVAEEVEHPDRNIPLGILGSLAFTTVLYALVVTVMVGVVPLDELAGSLTPMADAADQTLGTAGVVAVVLAAVLALVSTANAGVLSASRYPFAMARDQLVPDRFGTVSDRYSTPSTAITATGVVVLVLVAFVPLADIAKLASAFGILVFVLVNVAVVVFRESGVEYEPSFHSPLYPWMQLVGVVGGVVVLTQMGAVALLGALGIVGGSVAWYHVYARGRVDRVGALVTTLRERVSERAVTETARVASPRPEYEVLVGVTPETTSDTEDALLSLATDLAKAQAGRVAAVQFESVPDQLPLTYAAETRSPADVRFETQTAALSAEMDVPVERGEVVSHDTAHALVNYARHRAVDVLVLGHPSLGETGDHLEWVARHAPCDVVFVGDPTYGHRAIEDVTVVASRGPSDPLVVAIANAVAHARGATLTFEYAHSAGETATHRDGLEAYHRDVASVCTAPVRAGFVRADGGHRSPASDREDLSVQALHGGAMPWDTVSFDHRDEGPTLAVYSHRSRRLWWRALERLAY